MSPVVQIATDALSMLTLIGGVFAVLLTAALLAEKFGAQAKLKFSSWLLGFAGANALLLSFLTAAGSMAASLFYSDVAGFAPCILCWWQRVFLYPQVFILGTAIIKKDARALFYAMILSAAGGTISIYHSWLQFGGSPLVPCSASGVSCAQRYFLEYGYVTIPTMALTAFALIVLFGWASNFRWKNIAACEKK